MAIENSNQKLKIYIGDYEFSQGGGGGGLLNYTIHFKSDNNDYAVHSVASGTIQAPTTPAKSGYVFKGWGDTSSSITYYQFPYTPTSAEQTMNAVWQQTGKGTISGLGSSSTSSVVFNIESGLFDGITQITKDGNVFIKFPKMYRKVDASISGQITGITISNAQIDSSYHIYPCFLDEDGNELEYILMGKYCCSSTSIANSVNASASSMTIGNGRTLCRNLGKGYQQMDWQIFKLWQDLLIAKMQTIDTNSGSGIGVDQLGVAWEQSGSKTYPWIDGISWQGGSKQYAFSYKPSKYVDSATSSTDGYQLASYSLSGTSGDNITKLGYDTNHEFLNYPSSLSGSSYTSYYCDGMSYGTSTTLPVRSGVGNTYATRGAFGCDARYVWSGTFAVRLCYRPL